ncbi:MAG: GTP-binding protein [Chloroflexota bacterium]|nr:GTP-binding protein [Chloroflexota bacterium]MDQ5865757.1 GTP-binding protein [Chloroflexota bacterium]
MNVSVLDTVRQTMEEYEQRAETAPSIHYESSLAAVQETLAEFERNTVDENHALTEELTELTEMSDKLKAGHLDIVVFGEINTGKSSMINALIGREVAEVDIRGGKTVKESFNQWGEITYEVSSAGLGTVRLVDTPGINEVGGVEHAKLAEKAAKRADLVLFIVDADITQTQYDALKHLASLKKPMILVLNKVDRISVPDKEKLKSILKERANHFVNDGNIVEAAGRPQKRSRLVVLADGTQYEEIFQPEPQIDALKERILQVLSEEGQALIALNASLFAADTSDRVKVVRNELRNQQAQKIIIRHAVLKGLAVGGNPIPIADVAGGIAVDVAMVRSLATLYGAKWSKHQAGELIKSVAQSAGWVTVAEMATHGLVNVLNVVSLGTTYLITAIPQAVAGACGSYIVGKAAQYYFVHSGFDIGAKAVVQKILNDAETQSVFSSLKKQLIEELKTNRHAKSED